MLLGMSVVVGGGKVLCELLNTTVERVKFLQTNKISGKLTS